MQVSLVIYPAVDRIYGLQSVNCISRSCSNSVLELQRCHEFFMKRQCYNSNVVWIALANDGPFHRMLIQILCNHQISQQIGRLIHASQFVNMHSCKIFPPHHCPLAWSILNRQFNGPVDVRLIILDWLWICGWRVVNPLWNRTMVVNLITRCVSQQCHDVVDLSTRWHVINSHLRDTPRAVQHSYKFCGYTMLIFHQQTGKQNN